MACKGSDMLYTMTWRTGSTEWPVCQGPFDNAFWGPSVISSCDVWQLALGRGTMSGGMPGHRGARNGCRGLGTIPVVMRRKSEDLGRVVPSGHEHRQD